MARGNERIARPLPVAACMGRHPDRSHEPLRPRSSSSSGWIDFEELDVELKRRIGSDLRRRAHGAICEMGRDLELAFAALLHSLDADVPALDDLTLSDDEVEGDSPFAGAVEHRAVEKKTRVVHAHAIPCLRLRPRSDDDVLSLDAGEHRREIIARRPSGSWLRAARRLRGPLTGNREWHCEHKRNEPATHAPGL